MGKRKRKSRRISRAAIRAGLVLLMAVGAFFFISGMMEEERNEKNLLEAEANGADREPETLDREDPPSAQGKERWTIVLDPGHQRAEDPGLEPLGPGSAVMKKKVSSGTKGTTTGIQEYQYVLDLSLMVRDMLEREGFRVVMTRTGNDVSLSNIDRARIANHAEADLFLRIHANGSDNPGVHGISTYTMPEDSPYNPELAGRSERASSLLLDEVVKATGAKDRGNRKNNSYTGINWSEVPVVILETGFMTNPEEDLLMAMTSYREKMARGIARAIVRYIGE